MIIRLTRDEMVWAAQGGALRQLDAILKGRRSYFEHGDPWQRNILAAMAECAVAKWRNRYWTPTYDDPRGVQDIGTNGQVRSSQKDDAPLRVYPFDRDKGREDHAFVLVITNPPEFRLAGWLYGREAMMPTYWSEGGYASWNVPQSALRQISFAAVPERQAA